MRLIRQVTLFFQSETSDKVYEVDLCEAGEGEFLVNFRYGRRGARLRDGTKTPFPENLEKAESIFEKLVQSKVNKGYREDAPSQTIEEEKPSGEPVKENVDSISDGAGPLAFRKKMRSHLATLAADGSCGNWSLSRVVWKAGEAGGKDFEADLAKVEPKSEMDAYALSWALGRVGGKNAITRLREFSQSESEKVRRIAVEGLLRILPEKDARQLCGELAKTLPESIRNTLFDSHATVREVVAAVEDRLQNAQPPHDYFYTLYSQARFYPVAREAVHEILRTRPFKAPWFRAIRHIFKAAEFRLDSEIYGLIAWRFEKSDAVYSASWGRTFIPGTSDWVKTTDELQKPDSRLAYSGNTRNYLRKRVCRTLREAGDLGNGATFITLATGVLLAYDDEFDLKALRSETNWHWDATTRNYSQTHRHFGPYASYLPLNELLFANSSRYHLQSGLLWSAKDGFTPEETSGNSLPERREEAFPELWDNAPDAIAHILRHSNCGVVQEFAVGVWKANPAFKDLADLKLVLGLISKKFSVCQDLGIELARDFFDPSNPDGDLIIALLQTGSEAAIHLALGWLRETRSSFAENGEFIGRLLLIPHDAVHSDLRSWLGVAKPTEAASRELIQTTVAGLMGLDTEEPDSELLARNARESLVLIAGDHLGQASFDVVAALLDHPLPENNLLAAQMLSFSKDDPASIPDEIWESLLTSENQPVREIGMQLFAKLSDDSLLERSEILASFCLSEKDDIRRAARPIVERLVQHSPGFGQDMVLQFYPLTLRAESTAGLHDDVYELLSGPLKEHLHAIPAESSVRMMESRYAAGQKLGFLLFRDHIDPSTIPMRKLAALADQDHLEGREFIWNYYPENLERIKAEKQDALRILESKWEDSREFGYAFFREQFSEEDWSPAVLVSLCDNVNGEVQDFGREMITRFFREENGTEYLLKLSQHPSTELQTFATNYLERYAKGNVENIRNLVPYFTTVLSQVNCGRIAKQRVLKFLSEESLAKREVAEIIAPVVNRISATVAIGDKASCLILLRDLMKKWPDLDLAITEVKPSTLAPE